MDFQVIPQIVSSVTQLVAHGTREPLDVVNGPFVLGKTLGVGETIATEVTHVRSLTRMSSLVILETILCLESLATDSA